MQCVKALAQCQKFHSPVRHLVDECTGVLRHDSTMLLRVDSGNNANAAHIPALALVVKRRRRCTSCLAGVISSRPANTHSRCGSARALCFCLYGLALSLLFGCSQDAAERSSQGVTTTVTLANESSVETSEKEHAARAIFEDIASKNKDGELFFGVSYTQMMTYHARGYIKGLSVTQQQATNASLTGTPSRTQETEKPAATTAATIAAAATAATAAAITAVTTEFEAPTLSTGSSVPAPVPRLEEAVEKRNVITVGYREQQ